MRLTALVTMPSVNALCLAVMLIIWGIASPVLHAEEKIDLYSVEVAVASQGSAQRIEALRKAMAELVVRSTGTSISLESAQIREAISNAKRYVQQYAYRMTSRQVDGEDVEELRIRVDFDQRGMQRLLRDAGLPLWSSNRPTLMVWLAVSEQGQRKMVGASDLHPAVDALRDHCVYRGLPLVMPLLDLQDSANISEDDIWSLRTEKIYHASARYQADAFLAGRLLVSADGRLVGDWLFVHEGEAVTIEGTGENLEAYLNHAIDAAANDLAQKYAVHPSSDEQGSLKIVFRGVQDFRDYSAITHYIRQLVSVRQVKVRSIDRDVLSLSVRVDGSADQVVRMFSRNRRITPVEQQPQAEIGVVPEADLVFQWQRG